MPADVLGVTAIRPVERHGLEAIKWFLYNPDTGAVIGRTPVSWFLITIFYLVYYTCLAAFWGLCLFIFFQTIDDKVPRWQMQASLITSSPALGVRPNQAWEHVDSSMITFDVASEESGKKYDGWKEWADRTADFLAAYKDQTGGADCKEGRPDDDTKVCQFNLKDLKKCATGNYGYDKGQPCIFLKLNKIYGLEHEYYNDTASLPAEVPDRVKTAMAGLSGAKLNQVWVDCHGENPADVEAMGPISYFPAAGGFDSKYFPYLNQDGYVTPLVAVQFRKPAIGQLIHIECRAFAHNIKYDKRDKLGRAHFELFIHDSSKQKEL